MTARKTKSNTDVAVEVSPAELTPVELDDPDPVLSRWQELVDQERSVYHGGDIEKIMPFPRPAWSDPDQDLFATSLPCCLYRAEPVKVPATRHNGNADDDEIWTSAGMYVQPAIGGTDVPVVRVSFSEYTGRGWNNKPYMALTVTEAKYLIEVLSAAVNVLGGEK